MKFTMRTLSFLIVGLFIASSLPAQAQDVEPGIYNPTSSTQPTTMFFHINGFQDFPVNTQKPFDGFADTVEVGVASNSGCVDLPDGTTTFTEQSHHTWYGYSSPSYVEYDFIESDGKPRIHQERGISFDVDFDDSVKPKFTWYLEAKDLGPDGAPATFLPLSQVVVRAIVREGDDVSVGNTALNEGEIIAKGQTTPKDLFGPSTQADEQLSVHTVNGKTVYGFTFELDWNKAKIDKDESYNIRVDAFMDNPRCTPSEDGGEGETLMPDFVLVHTSETLRPQVEWVVNNPIKIEYLHPQFIGDDLVVHTSSNSPWGNYDVRGDKPEEALGGLSLEISGPSVPVTFDRVALTARTHEHDHHTEAVDATWIWEYKTDGAPEGLYTVTLTAQNDQETAIATAIAQFEIGSGLVRGCGGQEKGGGQSDCFDDVQPDGGPAQNQESPGVGFFAVTGLLGALAVAARRRQ